jgi:hypothetical protein
MDTDVEAPTFISPIQEQWAPPALSRLVPKDSQESLSALVSALTAECNCFLESTLLVKAVSLRLHAPIVIRKEE